MYREQVMAGKSRKWLTQSASVFAIAVVTASLCSLAHAADPSSGGGTSKAVKLEAIAGSSVKRVILTPKAAERLGIETGEIREETVVREQVVGGTIVPPVEGQQQTAMIGRSFAGFAPVTSAAAPQPTTTAPAPTGQVWVQVTLSQGEYNRLAKDQNARLEQLQTREKFEGELIAEPVNRAPLEDMKRSMLTLYYSVPGRNHGLELFQRVRVELPLVGEEASGPQKVVPYSAVYYDPKGVAWVYVTSHDLTYERQQIEIDRIVGDLAVLKEGPAVGTKIVTVGAAMLFGTEVFGK
jgi:hypothetical protein